MGNSRSADSARSSRAHRPARSGQTPAAAAAAPAPPPAPAPLSERPGGADASASSSCCSAAAAAAAATQEPAVALPPPPPAASAGGWPCESNVAPGGTRVTREEKKRSSSAACGRKACSAAEIRAGRSSACPASLDDLYSRKQRLRVYTPRSTKVVSKEAAATPTPHGACSDARGAGGVAAPRHPPSAHPPGSSAAAAHAAAHPTLAGSPCRQSLARASALLMRLRDLLIGESSARLASLSASLGEGCEEGCTAAGASAGSGALRCGVEPAGGEGATGSGVERASAGSGVEPPADAGRTHSAFSAGSAARRAASSSTHARTKRPQWPLSANAAPGSRTTRWRENLAAVDESSSTIASSGGSTPYSRCNAAHTSRRTVKVMASPHRSGLART
mmetsp:Transcript_32899/g.103310  ORF Transcript_32899/g.103310 Transcript_32899/m.103310 type:complete len:391 (-) Transcript_32899:147-1319(-)